MSQSYTEAQRKAFGQRLRAAREPLMKPQELALKMGYGSPSTVSNWESGANIPSPAVVFEIEKVLALPPGELSQHAGFLPVDASGPSCTIESAILADPDLSDSQREALLGVVAQFKDAV